VVLVALLLGACGGAGKSRDTADAASSRAKAGGSYHAAAPRDTTPDSTRADSIRRDSLKATPAGERSDSASRRAGAVACDSTKRDSTAVPVKEASERLTQSHGKTGKRKATRHPRRHSGCLPAKKEPVRIWPAAPTPLPGALLPNTRIVAFYGNPLSSRLGILGRIPPEPMLDSLARTAVRWQLADTTTKVVPALHLIATVAQGHPGPDRKHRLRMSDETIERVAQWAHERNWLLFLDLQVGQSTVREELPRLLPFLARPYVHLALDPEFAMPGNAVPGTRIGTLDAADVNYALRTLARLVSDSGLPPKVLVVHRFTTKMLTGSRQIERDPRVQVVIDMDGFGSPQLKRATWHVTVQKEPVQYTGFKLFLNPRNDYPLMTPEQVVQLWPAPHYIQYQ
jgi:hypothetical protein